MPLSSHLLKKIKIEKKKEGITVDNPAPVIMVNKRDSQLEQDENGKWFKAEKPPTEDEVKLGLKKALPVKKKGKGIKLT
jgi:hypothetical protein